MRETSGEVKQLDEVSVKSDSTPARDVLVLAPPAPPHFDEVRLQKLWLAVQRTPWRSLAILAASRSLDTLTVAEMLAQLAWRYRGEPSGVCDLRDLGMRLLDYHVDEVQAQVYSGTRLFIALRSIFENPTATPVARRADAVVLCIALGETDFKDVKETISAVGRERVVGSILVRRPPAKKGARLNGR